MGDKIRVMVVDDEPDIAAVLRPLLEPTYEVVVSTNGLDALLKLPQYEPDILIVDIMMPLMDGWEFALRVRSHPDFHEIPMIFLSALDSAESIRKGYSSGADVYITKPFDPIRVLKNLQVFVDRGVVKPKHKRSHIHDLLKQESEAVAGETLQASVESDHDIRDVVRKVGTRMPRREGKVKIPRPRKAVVSEIEKQEVEAPPSPTPRVMVVDDDPEVLDIIRLSLQMSFEVVTAENGFEALEKVPEAEPDLFVLDIMMPKMSGLQLLQILRQGRDTAKCPILILTAKGSEHDRKHILASGADGYMSKPFMMDALVDKVGELSHRAGFAVRTPKKKSIAQLDTDAASNRFEKDEDETHRRIQQTHKVLQKFLNRYGESDPYEKNSPPRHGF